MTRGDESPRSLPAPSDTTPAEAWGHLFMALRGGNLSSHLAFAGMSANGVIGFSLFLCIDHWGMLFYLSLLFFGTLHSDVYIFPFLLCFLLLFFSQLFVRPPQMAILLFCTSFPWGWSWSLSPVQCHEPHFIIHQTSGMYIPLLWSYTKYLVVSLRYSVSSYEVSGIWDRKEQRQFRSHGYLWVHYI